VTSDLPLNTTDAMAQSDQGHAEDAISEDNLGASSQSCSLLLHCILADSSVWESVHRQLSREQVDRLPLGLHRQNM
jgi:hypothetical protein